jgi:hypothetical protein
MPALADVALHTKWAWLAAAVPVVELTALGLRYLSAVRSA